MLQGVFTACLFVTLTFFWQGYPRNENYPFIAETWVHHCLVLGTDFEIYNEHFLSVTNAQLFKKERTLLSLLKCYINIFTSNFSI